MQPNDPKLLSRVMDITNKVVHGDVTVAGDIIDLLFEVAPASVWKGYLDVKIARAIDQEVDELQAKKFPKSSG